jgi:hypothetical protein
MRPVLKRQKNGVLTAIQFACDTCKYQVEASLPYINCMPAVYEPLPEPEVLKPIESVAPAVLPSSEKLAEMRQSLSPADQQKVEVPTQPIQASAETLPAPPAAE